MNGWIGRYESFRMIGREEEEGEHVELECGEFELKSA